MAPDHAPLEKGLPALRCLAVLPGRSRAATFSTGTNVSLVAALIISSLAWLIGQRHAALLARVPFASLHCLAVYLPLDSGRRFGLSKARTATICVLI